MLFLTRASHRFMIRMYRTVSPREELKITPELSGNQEKPASGFPS